MADARKQARRAGAKKGRRKKAQAPPPSPEQKPALDGTLGAAEPKATVELPPSGLAEDVLGQEEAPGADGGKIELPSSGLASDVLSQPEAQSIEAGTAELTSSEVAPEPPPTTGSQSLSFFAAPAQEQREATEASEHLATFVLEKEEYGVDVRQVQEIRRVSEITAVPRAPEFVRGVINLRGRILPVLDLKRKLALGEVEIDRVARIVVVRVQDRVLGLLVDGASQVLKVPVSRIEPPPDEVVERGGDYIRGVAKLEDRLIILIDLERALVHELREAPSVGGA